MRTLGRRLGIFYRQPLPGRVKTRLVPVLTPTEAAWLYNAMLTDTVQMARRLLIDQVVLFEDAERPGWRPPCPDDWQHRAQRGADLGRRMVTAIQELMEGTGPTRACLIGTDAPLLGAPLLETAWDALDAGVDLVTSPTPDGGYAILGMARRPPADFLDGIAWSTGEVLQRTEERARGVGWQAGRVAESRDVDTPDDLSELFTILNSGTLPRKLASASTTRSCLKRLEAAGRWPPATAK
ncbi:MAG TPA: TIGR04282 family arsenosugar biosynthesis glycosyltransferase [Candidatus Eisenbacteria bacterium]